VLDINHNITNGDYNDAIFLNNLSSGQRVQIGMCTTDNDGQHHRVSLRAYKGPASLEGQFRIAIRESNGNMTERYTFNSAGSLTADGDMRAPIFYDSNNTGFYIDPNGSTNINTLFAGDIYASQWFRNSNSNTGLYNQITTQHLSSNTNGYWDMSSTTSVSSIRFYTGGHVNAIRGYVYANDSNQIGFLNPGGSWSLRMDNINAQIFGHLTVGSSTSSDIYFIDTDEGTRRMHCNSGRIGFLSTAEGWGSYSTSDGSWRSDQAMYSPIYYDINNTGFYVDPASTTVLNGLTVGGYGVVRTAGTINNNIDSDYGETYVTFDPVPSGTPPISSPNIRTVNIGSNFARRTQLAFTFDTDRAWFRRRNDGGWGSWYEFAVFGNVASAGVLYGTIYYDGNNTGFYVDPASTSNTNSMRASEFRGNANVGGTGEATWHPAGAYIGGTMWQYGDMYKNNSPMYNVGYLGMSGANTNPIDIEGASNKYIQIRPGNGYEAMVRYIGGSGSSWSAGKRTSSQLVDTAGFHFYSDAAGATVFGITPSGIAVASSEMRAPIFYDSVDTSYYLNLNGLSRMHHMQLVSDWANSNPNEGAINIRGAYPSMTFRNTISGNMWLRHMDGSGHIQHYFAPSGVDATNWSIMHTMHTNGIFFSAADMRTPIFYDSNDTGFYLDPNSYSRLNRIGVGGAANDVSGININGDAGLTGANFFYFGHNNGLLGSWQTRTFASSGRQIWNTNGFEVNRDGYGGGWAFSINSAGSTTFNSTNDLPININGAMHKYLTINPGNGWEAMVRYIGGSGSSWYVGKRTATQTVSPSDFHLYSEAAGATVFGVTTGGTAVATGDLRAPIFYDSNDTAFYIDPNGTSNINTLYVGNTYTNAWFRNTNSNQGLYNEATTQHLSSNTNGYWDISSTTNASTGILGIRFYAGGHVNTLRGTVFSNGDGIGFLNAAGGWSVRCFQGGSNGGELGGSWSSTMDFRTPILYDRDNTAFYFDGSNSGDSIRVAGDVVAYFSDERLKDIKENIPNALEKVLSLNGFYYEPNEIAQRLGYEKKLEIGLSAQEVERILPEIIKQAPADVRYKTLNYAKLTPLLVEAIKEQQSQIESQQQQINKLTELINNLTK
jgi:hypothetical protein